MGVRKKMPKLDMARNNEHNDSHTNLDITLKYGFNNKLYIFFTNIKVEEEELI
jgi:hypothetical protein